MNVVRRTRLLVLAFSIAFSARTADLPPYLNPDLAPEKRAADLVSRMTLEEKVLQMQNSRARPPASEHPCL